MIAVPDLAGHDLGTRTIAYTERDAILYALSVGARAGDLDLVYERDLRVLPTYGLALGLWTVEAAGALGAYDPLRSLHAAQSLEVRQPLPPAGTLDLTGRIAAVWDKGTAAIIEVETRCPQFTATYSIFLPGHGGFGGERGPSIPRTTTPGDWHADHPTSESLAALYRLTGDLHPVHIDPDVAAESGFDGPILHGLCTLGIAARTVAAAADAHPCDLTELRARFAAPVRPGAVLRLSATVPEKRTVTFAALVNEKPVLNSGYARFT
ncbi:enoyl-CoA hydratase [Actinomadura madurae]|uniref:MaoC/PaaZ C-terminal domain-containing protein n=1 Tax=Actinomadura madurae TaxID=1993 RepID=UPI00399A706C